MGEHTGPQLHRCFRGRTDGSIRLRANLLLKTACTWRGANTRPRKCFGSYLMPCCSFIPAAFARLSAITRATANAGDVHPAFSAGARAGSGAPPGRKFAALWQPTPLRFEIILWYSSYHPLRREPPPIVQLEFAPIQRNSIRIV